MPGEEIDLVAEKNNKFFRIQIKTAYYDQKWDAYRSILLGANHRMYDENAFDYYAIYLPDKDDIYLVPNSKTIGKKSITIIAREYDKIDKLTKHRTFFPKDYLNNFNLI